METDERRKRAALTDDQIEAIKEAILASVYEDIGRSLVKKILWVAGVVFTVLLGLLQYKGYLIR